MLAGKNPVTTKSMVVFCLDTPFAKSSPDCLILSILNISNLVNVPCSLEYESSVKSEAPPPISNNEWLILKAATFKHFYSVYLEVDLSYIKDIK